MAVITAADNTDQYLEGTDSGDRITGRAGHDELYGFGGADQLFGGSGNDYLSGGSGSDQFYFELGHDHDKIASELASRDDRIIYGEGFSLDQLKLTNVYGALKLTFQGNAHDSILIGNYFLGNPPSSVYGVSRLEFADGRSLDLRPVLFEQTVYSYADAFGDFLEGYTGRDGMVGRAGDDWLSGLAGDDFIKGGAGSDTLFGDEGNDVLDGEVGQDELFGGAGNDVYMFRVGSGHDVIINDDASGIDRIRCDQSIAPDQLVFVRYYDRLEIHINNQPNDTMTIQGFFNSDSAEVDLIEFANGSKLVISGDVLPQPLYQYADAEGSLLEGHAGVDKMIGRTGADVFFAQDGDDVINGASGNDEIYGGAGNDQLIGGMGNDYLAGGVGNDQYYVNSKFDQIVEYAGEGVDEVFSSVTYTLSDEVEHLTLTGSALSATGNLLGNKLTGNQQDNVFDGKRGNDVLVGGLGNDTYRFARGYGKDTVVESDTSANQADQVVFLSNIKADQLWFKQVQQDLEVTVIGSTDRVVIKNWYAGSHTHVEQFVASDGRVLADTAVHNLVNAMAGLTMPAQGYTELSTVQHAQLDHVIQANWLTA